MNEFITSLSNVDEEIPCLYHRNTHPYTHRGAHTVIYVYVETHKIPHSKLQKHALKYAPNT